MAEQSTELQAVQDAVQHLANMTNAMDDDDAGLVGGILVLWQEVSFGDSGPIYSLRYASAGDDASPVTAVGLLSGALPMILRDGLGIGECDGDH